MTSGSGTRKTEAELPPLSLPLIAGMYRSKEAR